VIPTITQGCVSSWAQYSVLADDSQARDDFRSRLSAKGFPTAVYYPHPLHLQPAFDYLGYHAGDFPISEMLAERIFSFPMHPYLAASEVEAIVAAMAA
jgi:dTDP-4-amino-4,6-dideoxygalactose transaminase